MKKKNHELAQLATVVRAAVMQQPDAFMEIVGSLQNGDGESPEVVASATALSRLSEGKLKEAPVEDFTSGSGWERLDGTDSG